MVLENHQPTERKRETRKYRHKAFPVATRTPPGKAILLIAFLCRTIPLSARAGLDYLSTNPRCCLERTTTRGQDRAADAFSTPPTGSRLWFPKRCTTRTYLRVLDHSHPQFQPFRPGACGLPLAPPSRCTLPNVSPINALYFATRKP